MRILANKLKIGGVTISPKDIFRLAGENTEKVSPFIEVDVLYTFLSLKKKAVLLSITAFGEKTVRIDFKLIDSPINSIDELRRKIDEVKVKDGAVVALDTDIKDFFEINLKKEK